ncbi:MAG: 1,2-diacylglycerol 3-glucosyltransferase [bacterium]|nr:MAG: 1,2-diacylglycerol 3-glucosyltransferase [bacterium]
MNILIVNYEFPPLGGGAGNATYHIAKEMAHRGHKVLVVTSHFKGLAKEEWLDGFQIKRIPTLRKRKESVTILELLSFALSSLWYVTKIAKNFDPKVSFAFFGLPCGISTLLIKVLYGIPYIVSLRGADVPGFIERQIHFYHFIAKPLIRYIWKKASYVITNSQGLKELALKSSRDIKIEVIANGVDADHYQPCKLCDNGIKKILFVGRLSKQKGIQYLLNSISILKEKNINSFHLEIIGDGPDKAKLEEEVTNKQLEKQISLLGWVDKKAIYKKYQEASIFVFPSLSEGMPNVILEAMASGLPILATRIAGNEELVREGKNGYLVEVEDSQALADKLIELLQETDRLIEMGNMSRKIAYEEYSWGHVAEQYIAILKK